MRTPSPFSSLLLATALAACQARSAPKPEPVPVPALSPSPSPSVEKRGAPITTTTPPISVATALSQADTLAGKTVVIEDQVRAACSKKGCWMELGDGAAARCRVTFKDYGFFVPLDSAGAKARAEGTLELRTIPAGQVQHYEGEGGKFDKAADGSARELRLVATGVELRR